MSAQTTDRPWIAPNTTQFRTPTTAGWYQDPQGDKRWWDGTQWGALQDAKIEARGSRNRRWIGGIVLAVFAALVIATVVTVKHDTSTSSSPSSGGARIVADDGLGIGYGIRVDSDWRCGVVSQGTFACVGTAGSAYIGSGARGAYDVAPYLATSTGNAVAVRFDSSRWRCDTGVTALPAVAGKVGFACTQRS